MEPYLQLILINEKVRNFSFKINFAHPKLILLGTHLNRNISAYCSNWLLCSELEHKSKAGWIVSYETLDQNFSLVVLKLLSFAV